MMRYMPVEFPVTPAIKVTGVCLRIHVLSYYSKKAVSTNEKRRQIETLYKRILNDTYCFIFTLWL